MAAAASVAWFLEACGASPLRAPSATAAKAAARAHAEPPYDVPFDIVVLICMAAWQCDANAPLLAAINHKFKAASAEAATNVTTIDVMPRRANVTIPKNDSIDPEHGEDVVKFREELSRWGLRLEHYTQFRVHLPRVPSSYSQLVEKKTIANLLVDRQEKDGHAPPRLKYENIVSFSGSIDSTEAQGTLFDFSAQRFIFTPKVHFHATSIYRRKQFIETKNLSTESRAARGRETVPQDAFDTVSGTHRHRLDVHTLLAKILRFVDMPRRASSKLWLTRNIQRRSRMVD